jgi:hypothetical protein
MVEDYGWYKKSMNLDFYRLEVGVLSF